MSHLEQCLAILKALQISEVAYCLSGGGDSGTAELNRVVYADGREGPLPSVTLGITDAGGLVCLDERLEQIVSEIPDGDWCNNEGGYGAVILHPQESDEDLQVECDMTYGEDSEDPDFEDEEPSPMPDGGPDLDAGDALAIDDSNLQPAKGDAA
jgi:hypothetical protein